MIFRKTEKIYKRYVEVDRFGTHIDRIQKKTFWFLFIPIFSYEVLLTTSL